jgi:hypothetical protein
MMYCDGALPSCRTTLINCSLQVSERPALRVTGRQPTGGSYSGNNATPTMVFDSWVTNTTRPMYYRGARNLNFALQVSTVHSAALVCARIQAPA